MSKRTQQLAKALLLPINPAAVILLGIYTIVWGLWVANPFTDVFASAQIFGALAAVAPEVFWGFLAVACGVITTYGAISRKYGPLTRGAQASGWHWFMISIFYFIADAVNTGGITALTFAIYAAFVYLNIRVNFKDDKNSAEILH